MIERFVNSLVNQMEEEKFLRREMREEYVYTLLVASEKWISVLSILCLSIVLKQVVPTILFLVFFMPLRKRTGGYHADKFWQCYLGTLAIYIMVIQICFILTHHMNIVYCCVSISAILIGMIGTVNHPNMAMDCCELQKSKQAARYILALECMVLVAMIILKMREIFICYMSMAIILCATLLCIAKVLKQEVNCIEKR